jgi:hypothetical protein
VFGAGSLFASMPRATCWWCCRHHLLEPRAALLKCLRRYASSYPALHRRDTPQASRLLAFLDACGCPPAAQPPRLAATDARDSRRESAGDAAAAMPSAIAPEVLDFHEIPFKITSFALQYWDGGNNSAPETCETVDLRGSPCIFDSLGGIRFRISHSAFFQVNTVAFELLLQRLQVKVRLKMLVLN